MEHVLFAKPCETVNVVMKATLAVPEDVPPRKRYRKWQHAFDPVIPRRMKRHEELDRLLRKKQKKGEEELNEEEDDEYRKGDTLIFKNPWPKTSLLVWPETGGLVLVGASSEAMARECMKEAAEKLLDALF